MSFQAYLDTIKAKTGQSPDDLRAYAAFQGFLDDEKKLRPEVKAATLVASLKRDFDLGQGHAMAVYALLKGTRKEGD
ncbi:hypothetical protein M2336_000807 [Sphingobium sp. B1D7B]|uniref:DUF4287 domain-containing protein n=1 Tax=Sphingobium TaxID=165695 RepID=UPI0015EBDC94|nr:MULTISPECIES: DUF4287 domain-containing protein [Sphingobium]MCW2363610.1 hypothetical protein [Sphingobium sp. B10D3B]MCW2364803.1 hypothetical protein [Sphingobium sp. B7D2B]MCW2383434.1 hypothetical protein [Sphingobium sp. B2D3B]MCW2392483.1 hypothetical protein [Sphingobium sp. B11D3A]MCW2399591.1 hypothetical protein [Sphingobium sp. B2D3C]